MNQPFDEAVTFEALYDSMWKCRCGKMWKASAAGYVMHGIENTLKLESEISEGSYKPRTPHTFTLTYPKERPCSSTHIRDRIVQRSLNDLVIYPAMTKGFIWDNMACQKGKGTTRAMDRIDCFLHRYYINNGNSNDGSVLQWDVQGYYKSMEHQEAKTCFQKRLDEKTVSHAMKWLQRQYPYPVGYEPGSQMVQILGISFLDPVDHAVKEQMRAKFYMRYMDDGFIISNDKEFLEECKKELDRLLKGIGLHLHPTKTRIYPLKDGIPMLGFTFRLTSTGKVIRLIDPKNVKHERKKLVRMANKVAKGEITEAKYWECFVAWKAHAEKGNSYKLLQKMDKYAKEVLKEAKNERSSLNRDNSRTAC